MRIAKAFVIFSICLFTLCSCRKSDDANPKNEFIYQIRLHNIDGDNRWHLTLNGFRNSIDSSSSSNEFIITHEDLVVPQLKQTDFIRYDSTIISIEKNELIPKKVGETILIYRTPKGIDTTFIAVNKELNPSILE